MTEERGGRAAAAKDTITMTDRFGGRLHAALSCGVALTALSAASAQETIDTATTTPVATSQTGNLTVTGDGQIVTNGDGPAIDIDADATVTIAEGTEIDLGPEGVGETEDTAAILVSADVTGAVEIAGDIRVLSSVETLRGAQPGDFPDGRFGLLIADDARLDGDVTFARTATIAVESEGGAGVGVLGALDGDLTLDGSVTVEGDGAAGLRVADGAVVDGDVRLARRRPATEDESAVVPTITARGQGATAVDIAGDVGGQLSVGGNLRSLVFTDDNSVTEAPEGQTDLSVGAQDALQAGSALRVTGDVAGGISLARERAAVTDDPDTDIDETRTALGGSDIRVNGGAPAVLLDGGAVIGALGEDADEDGRGISGYGLYAGGFIASGVSRGNTDAVALQVADATVEGGLFVDAAFGQNDGGIVASATGEDAAATALFLTEDADLGRVLNDGTISASVASDTGDATAILDRSGTLTSIVNNGTISATIADFTGQQRGEDGEPLFEERQDADGETILDDNGNPAQFPDLDEDAPTNRAVALALGANTSGVTVENDGSITGAIDLGTGDDTVTNTGRLTGALSMGGGADRLVLDGRRRDELFLAGSLFGDIDTGDGDDAVIVRAGAFLGDPGATIFDVDADIDLGGGTDTVTVTGEGSRVIADLDFGGDGGGGTLSLLDGGRFDGTIANAGDVDVVIGGNASGLRLFANRTDIASLLTLEGGDPVLDSNGDQARDDDGELRFTDGAVLTFDVDVAGQSVSALNVLGDAVIADDTTIQTVFQAAFSDDLTTAIITAGGDLDIDIGIDRLTAANAAPFLFSQTLNLSDDGQSVVLNLRRRSADELGLNAGVAPAYEPLIAALVAANEAGTDDDGAVLVDDQGRQLRPADIAVGRAVFNLGAAGDLTSEDRFLSAFDQFLPAPLDAPLTYARTQTNSVTSLVTQRVDALREGTDGRRNAWLQESSYFVNRGTDGAARGFDGGGFVIALGLDAPIGPIDTVGISGSVASARYDEETGEDFPYDRLTYSVGAYAAEAFGPLRVDGRVAYGWASSESERNVVIQSLDENGQATGVGDVRRTAQGEWDGTQLSAYGRVLYAGRVGGWDVQPFASLDYLDLREDAYEETGDDVRTVAFSVDEREATSLRGNAGVVVGREFKTRPGRFDTSIPATIAPRLTLAYSEELDGGDLSGTYNFEDGDDFVLTQEKPGGAAIIGGDIVYENEYARLGAGGSVTALDETQIYTLRVGVGLKW